MTCWESHLEGHHHHHRKLFAVPFVIQSPMSSCKRLSEERSLSRLEEGMGPKTFGTLAYVPWWGLS